MDMALLLTRTRTNEEERYSYTGTRDAAVSRVSAAVCQSDLPVVSSPGHHMPRRCLSTPLSYRTRRAACKNGVKRVTNRSPRVIEPSPATRRHYRVAASSLIDPPPALHNSSPAARVLTHHLRTPARVCVSRVSGGEEEGGVVSNV